MSQWSSSKLFCGLESNCEHVRGWHCGCRNQEKKIASFLRPCKGYFCFPVSQPIFGSHSCRLLEEVLVTQLLVCKHNVCFHFFFRTKARFCLWCVCSTSTNPFSLICAKHDQSTYLLARAMTQACK